MKIQKEAFAFIKIFHTKKVILIFFIQIISKFVNVIKNVILYSFFRYRYCISTFLIIMKRRLSQDTLIAATAQATATGAETGASKMDVCWKHIFDYLKIVDVYSTAQTCKHMNKIAGDYLREFIAEVSYALRGNKIECTHPYWLSLEPNSYQFVSRLELRSHNELSYTFDARTFPSLKTLTFSHATLTAATIESHRMLLTNIENLHLRRNWIKYQIFQAIRIYCPKLKCLDIDHPSNRNYDIENNLFAQHYPHLEDFRYTPCSTLLDARNNHLETFLRKHSGLKQFTTNFHFLWLHRDIFSVTNIQLEMLTIVENLVTNVRFGEFAQLLKRLFERGVYKLLNLSLDYWRDELNLGRAISRFPGLHKLCTLGDFDFTHLPNLRKLHLRQLEMPIEDVENIARILTNLEELIIDDSKIDYILPFLRYSSNLKRYATNFPRIFHNNCALDLITYNQERKQLANACKITIYVHDRFYIPTKLRYNNLNLSHIQIMRSHVHECN